MIEMEVDVPITNGHNGHHQSGEMENVNEVYSSIIKLLSSPPSSIAQEAQFNTRLATLFKELIKFSEETPLLLTPPLSQLLNSLLSLLYSQIPPPSPSLSSPTSSSNVPPPPHSSSINTLISSPLLSIFSSFLLSSSLSSSLLTSLLHQTPVLLIYSSAIPSSLLFKITSTNPSSSSNRASSNIPSSSIPSSNVGMRSHSASMPPSSNVNASDEGSFSNMRAGISDSLSVIELLTRDEEGLVKGGRNKQGVHELVGKLMGLVIEWEQSGRVGKEGKIGLKILVNLCAGRSGGVMSVRRGEKYRDFLKTVSKLSEEEDLSILTLHLLYLIKSEFTTDTLKTGFNTIKEKTVELFKSYKPPRAPTHFISQLHDLSSYLSSLLTKLIELQNSLKRNGNEDVGAGLLVQESGSLYYSTLSALVEESLKLFSGNRVVDPTAAEAVFRLLGKCLVEFGSISDEINIYKRFLELTVSYLSKYASELSSSSSSAHALTIALLSPFESIVGRVRRECYVGRYKDIYSTQFGLESYLGPFLEHLELRIRSGERERDINNIILRIIRHANIFPDLHALSLSKLNPPLISTYVSNLLQLNTTEDERTESSVTKSLVEVLVTMSEYHTDSTTLNALLAFVQSTEVVQRIGSSFFNGDKDTISNVLAIVATTGFIRQNLEAMSSEVVERRSKILLSGKNMCESSPNEPLQFAAFRLEKMIANFGDYKKLGANLLPSQVHEMYEMREEVLKSEISDLRQQLEIDRKNLNRLRSLIDHQVEIITSKQTDKDKSEWEALCFQKKFEKERANSEKTISKVTEERKSLSVEVEKLRKDHHSLEKRIGDLTTVKNDLTKKLDDVLLEKSEMAKVTKADQQEIKSLKASVAKYKEEIAKLGTEVSNLKKSVSDKTAEIQNLNMLLDREKKTVDTIRGLIGK